METELRFHIKAFFFSTCDDGEKVPAGEVKVLTCGAHVVM